jgi:hypothetical protein
VQGLSRAKRARGSGRRSMTVGNSEATLDGKIKT